MEFTGNQDNIPSKTSKTSKTTEPDLSYSMMIDKTPSSSSDNYNTVKPRTRSMWVEDSSDTKCLKCGAEFGLWVWRHHCRHCGYLFCGNCSNKFTVIPAYIKIPKPIYTSKLMGGTYPITASKAEDTTPKRVCDNCYSTLSQLKDLELTIEALDKSDVDLDGILEVAGKSELHNQYVNYYLSNFREIQYKLANSTFTNFEKHALWVNRNKFIGHSMWLTQLLKSVDYQTDHDKIPELISILEKHHTNSANPVKCQKLMCTRRCSPKLNVESALMLLDRKIGCQRIHEYAVGQLELLVHDGSVSEAEFLCYIPYLVENGIQSAFSIITDWLVRESVASLNIANEVFWCIQIGIGVDTSMIQSKYNAFFIKWKQAVSAYTQELILRSDNFIKTVRKAYDDDTTETLSGLTEVILPTDMEHKYESNGACQFKHSVTKPIVIPLKQMDINIVDKHKIIMYKREDIRKDQIIMSVIRLMDCILKKAGMDLNIVTYNIRPTGKDEGILEMVQNCRISMILGRLIRFPF